MLHASGRLWWADPMAALLIAPLILYEGREAVRGKGLRLLTKQGTKFATFPNTEN